MKGAAPVKVQNRRSFLLALTAKETRIQKNIAGGGQMQFVEIASNQGTSQRSASLKIQTQNLNKLTLRMKLIHRRSNSLLSLVSQQMIQLILGLLTVDAHTICAKMLKCSKPLMNLVDRRKTPARRPLLAMTVFLFVIGIDFVGSRHLVFN
jgi:hypothetical protein